MHSFISPMLVCFVAGFMSSGCKAEDLQRPPITFSVDSILLSESGKAFATDDFNNDGYIDLIIAGGSTDRIIVFLNDSKGTIERVNEYPAGDNPTWLASLDFNGDGRKDLAIANHETASITLLRGNGDGTFEPSGQSPVPIESEPHSHMIDVADFNADGFPDIVVDSRDRFGLIVLQGMEDGRFSEFGKSIDVGGAPYLGFAIGDINADSVPDLVTPNRNDISVLLGSRAGDLKFEKKPPIPFQAPFTVAVADITGDKHVDIIAVSGSAEPGAVIFQGDGTGHFKRRKAFPINSGAKSIALGDITGDGLPDVAVSSWNSQVLLILGDKVDPKAIQLPLNDLQNPWGLKFGDFNRDGRDELVVGDGTSGHVNIYTANTVEE